MVWCGTPHTDGVYGYIRSIDDIVGDCSDFFLGLAATDRYAGLPFFVYGESMGGEEGGERVRVKREEQCWLRREKSDTTVYFMTSSLVFLVV